jgi:hypothetical protein
MIYPKYLASIFLLVSFLFLNKVFSQESTIRYQVELNSNISSQDSLTFWQTANKFGAIPNSNTAQISAGLFRDFKDELEYGTVDYALGAQVTSSLADRNETIINQLYASARWGKVQLDAGVKHREVLFEGLSSSNGEITYSNNARSIPGYNIYLIDFVKLPFAKKWLSFKGNYSDYLLNDKRAVDNARLHHKSLHFKYKLSEKLELITGLNHYVQWGGTSSTFGKQPSSFKDYLRVITAQSGGSDSTIGDQINALGNTLGSYLVQLNYSGEKTNWNFYWSHPFEDRSGRELSNYPDALYGVFIDLKKPNGLISHISTEVTYTKHGSGNSPHYRDGNGVFVAASGRDNYFNNGIYESGWTYFGNTIGSPYFSTIGKNDSDVTQGIIEGDNRFTAFNIGIKGCIHKFNYMTKLSHVTYLGWFDNEYEVKPKQFSGILEIKLPEIQKFPIDIAFGTSFDTGTYSPINFGGFLKLSKRGVF